MNKKVEVTIINRPFTFVGEDEEKITRAAAFVDERIQEVINEYGLVNTMNAVIMAMMLVADEFLDMKDKAKNFEGRTLKLIEKVDKIAVPCGVRDKW